jgi:SAM-dependent methyltransferase
MTIEAQKAVADAIYSDTGRWDFHFTSDPLVRYLRDRRLAVAVRTLRLHGLEPQDQTALVVCGGVGGEGHFLLQHGFAEVTVSDISEQALRCCEQWVPGVATLQADAEALPLQDESFDVVLVQDGLHHLPRPTQGLTEMLRVARKAVVVLEPHDGAVGRMLGTQWEKHGDAVNYVFRWDNHMLASVARSFTLIQDLTIVCQRLWDHSGVMYRALSRLPSRAQTPAARAFYGLLAPVGFLGNNMVAVIVKPEQ